MVFNQQTLTSHQVVSYLQAFIDPSTVLSMFMLSYMLFLSGRESVQVCFPLFLSVLTLEIQLLRGV
jgi:hypothetical protein